MVIILVVRDAIASSEPFASWIFLVCLLREDEHFHSIIVKWVWLSEVQNIELILHSFPRILHSEIVPYYDAIAYTAYVLSYWCHFVRPDHTRSLIS